MKKTNSNALHAAAEWFVQLTSGEATAQDREAWQAWVNADAEHKQAWQRIEGVTSQFKGLDPKTSIAVLNRPSANSSTSNERRQAVKTLGLLFAVGTAGWLTYNASPWDALMADYATATGEIKHIQLSDGTRLVLNTNSQISVDFDEQHRNVRLLKGEVYIETAHEENRVYRPFNVITDHGIATALGTRFSTRVDKELSCVNVYQDIVKVQARTGETAFIKTGESVKFTSNLMHPIMMVDDVTNAWTKGFIIADKMPLVQFVEELARYKSGILRCDPAIASLEISGSYPLTDIDATLNSISKIFPIKIDHMTRYWITLKPA
jgi:transmembrane sensor